MTTTKTKRKMKNSSPTDVVDTLRTMAQDTKEMVGTASQEHLDEALGALHSGLDAAHEHLTEYYETAKKKAVAAAKTTDGAIRDNPYAALGIAAGLGVLVGLFLARSRD